DRCSAALPKRGAELIARYLFTRRRLACGLLARRLLAARLLPRRLLAHPWWRVFELGPYRRRGHDRRPALQRSSAANSFKSASNGAVPAPAIAGIYGTSPPDQRRSPASWADCLGRCRMRRAVAASAAAAPASAATAGPPRRTWSSQAPWRPNSRPAISDGRADAGRYPSG